MDLDAQIRALEEQVARESNDIEQARAARGFGQQQVQQQVQQQAPQQGFASAQTEPVAPADGAAKQPPRFARDADDRSVFINNIPKREDVTPDSLAALFADCGQIMKCTLLRNRTTNELKGTAYIEFGSYESAGRAIDTKNNCVYLGNTLTVAKKKSMYDPARGRGGAGEHRGGRGGRGRGGQQEMLASMMGMMMGAMAQMQGGGRGGRGRGRGRGGHGGAPPGAGGEQQHGFKPFQ